MPKTKNAKTYQLAGTTFTTKDQIRQYVRSFIDTSDIDQLVNDPVILHLLSIHPEWHIKSAGMISLLIGKIYIPHAKTSSKNVLIATADGHVDISLRWCIDLLQHDGTARVYDKRKDHLAKIKSAARTAIGDQIFAVPKRLGEEIDHIYPRTFDRLLYLFLKWWAQPIMEIQIDDPPGAAVKQSFADWEIDMQWQLFHKAVAKLRAIPAEVNRVARVYPVNWSNLP